MVEPVSKEIVLAVAEAYYNECRLVSTFLESKVKSRLTGQLEQKLPQGTTHALFNRAVLWLRTLQKLNNSDDFQSAVSCSRALFELAIDLTLMVYRPLDRSADRLLAWEESADLASAEKIIGYYQARSLPLPSLYDVQREFYRTQTTRVHAQRVAHGWSKGGKTFHPPRWTNRTLIQDAEDADNAHPGSGFEEFYCTRFAQLCWGTHGSSLALIRYVPTEMMPGIGAQPMRESNVFAIRCAELALRHASLWNDSIKDEFEALRIERIKLTAGILRYRKGAADSGVDPV